MPGNRRDKPANWPHTENAGSDQAQGWARVRQKRRTFVEYVVYCDESRHNGATDHRYMAIGGLWVPKGRRLEISRGLRDLCRKRGLNGEIKWSKVSTARLEDYKTLVDYFFSTQALQYRVIVVDQSKVDSEKFHGGDAELGFYKFYYQMLKSWIHQGNEYVILLDFKRNKNGNRYSDLRRILGRRARVAGAVIRELTVIDSGQSPLAQLCDLLTGSVAASCCSDIRSAKASLAGHIASLAGLPDLRAASISPSFNKFNIFRIKFR